jgi:ribonuclease E
LVQSRPCPSPSISLNRLDRRCRQQIAGFGTASAIGYFRPGVMKRNDGREIRNRNSNGGYSMSFQKKSLISTLSATKKALIATHPVSSTPTASRPVAQRPAAQRPVAQRPAAQRPAAQRPVAQRPAAQRPAAQRPVAQRPAAQRPAAQRPIAQRPAAQRPVAQRPVAQRRKA